MEVESWAAGATKSTFDSLPFTELTSWFGIDAKDIWAAGSLPDGTFAFSHFDGKLWTETPRRFSEALSSLAVPKSDSGPPARRYFLSGKRWVRACGDELVEHSLPHECAVLEVTLDAEDFLGELLERLRNVPVYDGSEGPSLCILARFDTTSDTEKV